jgi:predicted nucleotidyltransferase
MGVASYLIGWKIKSERGRKMRHNGLKAAMKFIEEEFSNCDFALLAGSVARNQQTETSDLDIIIFDEELQPHRAGYERFGWKIEAFVHTRRSYKSQLEKEKKLGRPIAANMIHEGIPLKEDKRIPLLKKEVKSYLEEGPEPLSKEFVEASRYFIYDLLDDFKDSKNEDEAIYTLNVLSIQFGDFILRSNNQWSGRGKGFVRALNKYNDILAKRYFDSLQTYYKHKNKEPIIKLVDEFYSPLGGQLHDGFRM